MLTKQVFLATKTKRAPRVSTPKMIRYNFTTDNYFQKQITHTKFTKYFLVRYIFSGQDSCFGLWAHHQLATDYV